MSPTKALTGLSRERVREILSLAVWQVELAGETGLLQKLSNGRYDERSVHEAKTGGGKWRSALALESRLDATEAAARLGCNAKEFTRLASEHGLNVVATGTGRRGTIRYYRAADVDAIAATAASGRRRTRENSRGPAARENSRGPGRANLADLAREFKVSLTDVEKAASTVHARVQRGAGGTPFVTSSREHDIRRQLGYDIDGRGEKKQKQSQSSAETAAVADGVRVWVRDRKDNRMQVTIHLGPTNSGKTYSALQRLAESGSGVYAAPLRMLAREAYQKMCDQIGVENVGLITGEESVNPGAPVLCCTAEMAPLSGTFLVVDEAHWAAETERGHAWTRLLVGGDYDIIEVAASAGAEVFLTSVFDDVQSLDVQRHTRLSPLTYGGGVTIAQIPDQSLVVAFSRKAVHALAKRLLDAGRTVGVLYGALPPETRVEQIRKFMAGEVQVLVCTDVVGHGINTPSKAVVLAQTDKFDGTRVRDLDIWEAAQIVGRAGRYGLGGAGKAFTLTGEGGFTPKADLVRDGALAAGGHTSDGLKIERGLLRPTYRDLGTPQSHQLGVALQAWADLAAVELLEHTGVEAVPIDMLSARWLAAADALGIRPGYGGLTREWPIDGDVAWKILTTPVDIESPVFPALLRSLAENHDRFETVVSTTAQLAGTNLDAAETAAGVARDLMVVARLFPDIRPGLHTEAAALERRATVTIGKRLAQSLRTSTFGMCEECGKVCAPHFGRCDSCHSERR
jgi:ATP-dependent RNA helicase SUPV3L1/SUV3